MLISKFQKCITLCFQVMILFIHWTHMEWQRRRPMLHVTLLTQQLPAIAHYRVHTGLKRPLACAKNIREQSKCSEQWKILPCTPCTTNSKHLTLIQPPLHVINDTTDPRSDHARKFFVVSSHEKRKWAQQLIESRRGRVQPSKIEAKTTSTGIGEKGDLQL